MNTYAIPELADNVFAVGCKDWKRRIFDALAPTPLGTTYNSYIVRGDNKTALIDTNHVGFETEFGGKIEQVLGSFAIDYIVMNHAEPDHAGLIPFVLERCNARVLCMQKGAELIKQFYQVPEDRIQVIKDGDSIDLGGKTLRFIFAPFLHWPETMFTWLEEDAILFSGDFFAAHNTTGYFDDRADDVIHWAKKYYGEIMMPLAKMGRMGMDKIKNLKIRMIAPTHGPIYRDTGLILDHYAKWVNQETKPKAIVAYVSMYRNTEQMAMLFAERLLAKGIEVRVFDMTITEPAELAGDMVDTAALVIGTPTVLGAIHPRMQYLLSMIKTLKPPARFGVILNSYGWGKHAIMQGTEFFEQMKIELVGSVGVNGAMAGGDDETIRQTADLLADKILP